MYQSFKPPKTGRFEHTVNKDVWNSSRRV